MSKYSENKPYKVVALCTAKFYGSEEIDFIKTFYSACLKRNCRVVVFSTYSDFFTNQIGDESEKKIFSLMDASRFDAVIISTETFKDQSVPEKIAAKALNAGVPVFSLIRPMDGCISISFSYGNAFEQIVRHLVEDHKLRDFIFIAGMKNNTFSQERIDCFLKVLNEKNIPFNNEDLYYCDFWEGPTGKAMDKILASGRKLPEAFVCANDFMAMEVCRKLADAGYDVPKDVIVTGFDGVYLERFNYPRLTTAEQDLEGLSDILFDVIEKKLSNIDVKTNYVLDFRFRKSMSCGCSYMKYSEEEYRNMGIAFSRLNRSQREFVSIFENLSESAARYAHTDDLMEVFPNMTYHLSDVKVNNFFLMLNTDFMSENLAIRNDMSIYEANDSKQYYSSDMIVAMNYRDGILRETCKVSFSELMPDFEAMLDNNSCLLFSSLHVMGRTIGYVANAFNPETFEFAMYYAFVMNLRQILETHKVKQDLDNLYSRDQLTKLYNRRGFYNHVSKIFETAKLEEKQFAFISFDMNWLKQINDTFGHAEGDFALYTVANAMRASCMENEIASRFGGDEFAIGFACDNAEKRACELLGNIRKEIGKHNSDHNKKYNLSISAGFWAAIPGRKQELEEFIRLADEHMYADKKRIKGAETWIRG